MLAGISEAALKNSRLATDERPHFYDHLLLHLTRFGMDLRGDGAGG